MTEMASHTEIEKKYLLESAPEGLSAYPATHIRQGYLKIADEYELRIREKSNAKGKSYTMTFKSGSGLERTEYEVAIDEVQFNELWGATEGKRIEKMRYKIPLDRGLTLEVDVYESIPGLVTAEVEFPDVNTAASFVPPVMLFGAREVTGNIAYANQTLAVQGMPRG
jgi:adenylate cyclase